MRRSSAGVLASILASAALVFGSPGSACACSCVELTDAEAFEGADAVFVGTLVDTTRAFAPFESPAPPATLEFEVDGVYKGEVAELQGIATPSDTCAAGPLQGGEDYLVFASFYDGKLNTSLCSGTRLLDEAAPFPGSATAAPMAGEADLAETNPWPLIAAAAALAAAIGGVAWWRLRRRI